MAEGFEIKVGDSYAILYCVMVATTLLAFIASSYIPVPKKLASFLVASNGKNTVANDDMGDFYLSARNSANGM